MAIEEIFSFYHQHKDKVLKVNIALDNVGRDVNISSELTLGKDFDNPFTMMKYVDEIPAAFAFYARLYDGAEAAYVIAESSFEKWVSSKGEEVHHEMVAQRNKQDIAAGLKKAPTKEEVRYAVERNFTAEWTTREAEVLAKKEARDTMLRIYEGFKVKKDLLITQGSILKSLMENKFVNLDSQGHAKPAPPRQN